MTHFVYTRRMKRRLWREARHAVRCLNWTRESMGTPRGPLGLVYWKGWLIDLRRKPR